MGWLCLPELEASKSGCASGSNPSATSKTIPMQLRFCMGGLARGSSRGGNSGTTSGLSTGDPGVDRWISSRRASRARTSRLRDAGRAWRASAPAFSSRSRGWPRKRDPRSYSLKTSRGFASEAFRKLGRNWPISASIVDGILYPLSRWALASSVGAGSVWPILRATSGDYTRDRGQKGNERLTTSGRAKLWAALTARDWRSLAFVRDRKEGRNLTEQVGSSLSHRGRTTSKGGRRTSPASLVLNPRFCEALMGFPAGWTESDYWATRSSRRRRGKRSAG